MRLLRPPVRSGALALTLPLLAGCAAGLRTGPVSPADTLVSLSASGADTCVATASGAAYCWGTIGPGDGGIHRVTDEDGRPAVVRSVAVTPDGVCAAMRDGALHCDRTVFGGRADTAAILRAERSGCGYGLCLAPPPLPGSLEARPVRQVTAGEDHACALAADGSLHCWGDNRMGALGTGTWAARAPDARTIRVPERVAAAWPFDAVAAGGRTTCGTRRSDGALFCWGNGQAGQAGDAAKMRPCTGPLDAATQPCSTALPHRVLPDSAGPRRTRPSAMRFRAVAVGGDAACAVSVAGGVHCWGANDRCVLGRCDGTRSPAAIPVPLVGRAVEVGVGEAFACARTLERRIFCWGDNAAGQLGSLQTVNAGADGRPPDFERESEALDHEDPCFLGGRCSPLPLEVSPGRRWEALAVGRAHACALAADDGRIHCWGGGASIHALGPGARPIVCENRSPFFRDVPCQPEPHPVPGLPRLAPPRPTPDDTARPPSARVVARRDEVRLVFPPLAADRPDGAAPAEAGPGSWTVVLDGLDGPRRLSLRGGAATLAASGERIPPDSVTLCAVDRPRSCESGRVSARREGDRVVLVLRDSALLVELFGLRPATVRMWPRGGAPTQAQDGEVPVEYADPQIPPPDSAMRARAARGRLAYERSITSVSRHLAFAGERGWFGTAWRQVGDTVTLAVGESRCLHDVCSLGETMPAGAAWSLSDSTVARLASVEADAGRRRGPRARTRLILEREGRVLVRVEGIRSPLDSVPAHEPPPSAVTREVVVTERIARVELTLEEATVRAGRPVAYRTRVLDVRGRPVPGAPVSLEVRGGPNAGARAASERGTIVFPVPGLHEVTASFAGHTATVTVRVLPAAPDP